MHYYNLFVHFYFVKTVHSYFIILRHILLDLVGLLYLAGAYGEDTTYDCYLVKFDKHWEILVCKKGKAQEKIKLKDKFELKKNFLCDGYKYKVHNEITHEIYNYLKYSC